MAETGRRNLLPLVVAGLLLCLAAYDYLRFMPQAFHVMTSTGDFRLIRETSETFMQLTRGYRVPALGTFDVSNSGAFPEYPPTFYFVMQPVLGLPLQVSAAVWLMVIQVSVVAAVAMVLFGLGHPRLGESMVGCALILLFIPLRVADNNGQFGPVILALSVGALWTWQRRAAPLSGALLGLAICIKIYPVLLLPYFLWRRAFATVAWSLTTVAAVVVATLVAGWGQKWLGYPALLAGIGDPPGTIYNQSVGGNVLRFLAAIPGSEHAVWLHAARRALTYAIAAGFAGTALIIVRRLGTEDRVAEWLGYGVVLVTIPLLLPFSWGHYWVSAVVLILVSVRLSGLGLLNLASLAAMVLSYLLLMATFFLNSAQSTVPPGELSRHPALFWTSPSLLYGVVAALVGSMVVSSSFRVKIGSAHRQD